MFINSPNMLKIKLNTCKYINHRYIDLLTAIFPLLLEFKGSYMCSGSPAVLTITVTSLNPIYIKDMPYGKSKITVQPYIIPGP